MIAQTSRNHTMLMTFLCINGSISSLGSLLLPMVVGGMAKSGVNAQWLGYYSFIELAGASGAALAASVRMHQIEPFRLCIYGAVLAAASCVLSIVMMKHAVPLLAARLLFGIGTGMMGAGSLASVARIADPERAYGYIGLTACIIAVVGLFLAPALIAWNDDASGLFAFEGIISLFNAVLLRIYLPRLVRLSLHENSSAAEVSDADVVSGEASVPKLGFLILVCGLGSLFFVSLCDATVWTFAEPIGENAGLSLSSVSTVLLMASIVGAVAQLLAARIGARAGFAVPLTIGQALMTCTSLALTASHGPGLYEGAVLIRVFAMQFMLPLYSGLLARVDTHGRVIAAAGAFAWIGYAIGPLVGGHVVDLVRGDFLTLGIVAVAASAVSLVMTYVVLNWRRISAAADGETWPTGADAGPGTAAATAGIL